MIDTEFINDILLAGVVYVRKTEFLFDSPINIEDNFPPAINASCLIGLSPIMLSQIEITPCVNILINRCIMY